jgi:signal transduction histidine kinase
MSAPSPAAGHPFPPLPPHEAAAAAMLATLNGLTGRQTAWFGPEGGLRHASEGLLSWLAQAQTTPAQGVWSWPELEAGLLSLALPRPAWQALEAIGSSPLHQRVLRSPAQSQAQQPPQAERLWRCHVHSHEHLGRWLECEDITDAWQTERERSAFLSHAAHELRTPMASILGFSDLLSQREFPPAQKAEMATIIHRQASSLMALINNLLDLARLDARGQDDLRPERTPLHALLLEVAADGTERSNGRRVQVDCRPPSLEAEVDTRRLKRALQLLLLNADQHSPPTAPIVLSAFAAPGPDGSSVTCLEVQDSGHGMVEQEQRRAFERFFRGSQVGETRGNGLGLSLVQEIMRLHGGQAQLWSAPGQGTRVRLTLPPPRRH